MNEKTTKQFSILRLFAAIACCAAALAISVALFGRSPVASLIVTIVTGCLAVFIVVSSPRAWLRLATPIVGAAVGFPLGLLLYRSPLPGAAYGVFAAVVVYLISSMSRPERRFKAVLVSLLFLSVVALIPFGISWRHNVAEFKLDNAAGIRVRHYPEENKRFGTGFLADLMGPYVVRCRTTLELFDRDVSGDWNTDTSMSELASQFQHLRDVDSIYIESDRITDSGLAHFARVKGVTDIQFVSKSISTEGIKYFRNSPSIETMLVRCPQVDDSIIDVVRSIPRLKDIYLDETMVSDEAIRKLANFPKLKFITVPKSATDEAVNQLRTANKVVSRIQAVPN